VDDDLKVQTNLSRQTVLLSSDRSPSIRVQSLPLSRHRLIAWQNGSVHIRFRDNSAIGKALKADIAYPKSNLKNRLAETSQG
jgi:hypothetical protein